METFDELYDRVEKRVFARIRAEEEKAALCKEYGPEFVEVLRLVSDDYGKPVSMDTMLRVERLLGKLAAFEESQ